MRSVPPPGPARRAGSPPPPPVPWQVFRRVALELRGIAAVLVEVGVEVRRDVSCGPPPRRPAAASCAISLRFASSVCSIASIFSSAPIGTSMMPASQRCASSISLPCTADFARSRSCRWSGVTYSPSSSAAAAAAASPPPPLLPPPPPPPSFAHLLLNVPQHVRVDLASAVGLRREGRVERVVRLRLARRRRSLEILVATRLERHALRPLPLPLPLGRQGGSTPPAGGGGGVVGRLLLVDLALPEIFARRGLRRRAPPRPRRGASDIVAWQGEPCAGFVVHSCAFTAGEFLLRPRTPRRAAHAPCSTDRNVLFVIVDDLRQQLAHTSPLEGEDTSQHGDAGPRRPRTRGGAARTRSSPSRSSVSIGRRPNTVGVFDEENHGALPRAARTAPASCNT